MAGFEYFGIFIVNEVIAWRAKVRPSIEDVHETFATSDRFAKFD